MTRYPSGLSSDLVGGWLKQTHNSFYKYSAATSFNSNLGMDHAKSNYSVKLKLSGLIVRMVKAFDKQMQKELMTTRGVFYGSNRTRMPTKFDQSK